MGQGMGVASGQGLSRFQKGRSVRIGGGATGEALSVPLCYQAQRSTPTGDQCSIHSICSQCSKIWLSMRSPIVCAFSCPIAVFG